MQHTGNNTLDVLEIRELSVEELEATSGAGIISWIKCLFGGCGEKQPARGPHNRPADHLK
jgi:hypothetical protein